MATRNSIMKRLYKKFLSIFWPAGKAKPAPESAQDDLEVGKVSWPTRSPHVSVSENQIRPEISDEELVHFINGYTERYDSLSRKELVDKISEESGLNRGLVSKYLS